MNLKVNNFKPDYNKNEDDIAEEFYLPAMESSCRYDRISGYFGSTIYIIAWSALTTFVNNGGKIRIICSPVISDKDKDAMAEGYDAIGNEIVKEALSKELAELFELNDLEKPYRALACLIAEGVIDIKIAIPKKGAGAHATRMFHDKVGIFADDQDNAVGFRGSMNETFQGLSDAGNLESIDVFPSWEDKRDAKRVEDALAYFQKLWDKEESNVLVYDFPDALKEKLIEKSNGYNWKELAEEISTEVSLERKWTPSRKNQDIKPRPHQMEALENWEKNGRRGILEHATGSGKTYTAICAIRDALNRKKTVLVLVPSKELLHQWKKEIEDTIMPSDIRFLICGDGNSTWKTKDTLTNWTKQSDWTKKITIAMMDTACGEKFLSMVAGGNHLLLIADEVHRIGSPNRKRCMQIESGERLGLSATPERYGDPEGTQAIFDYFGKILDPIFTLKDAIVAGVLTKYYYHPKQVELTHDEQDSWDSLTKEINKIVAIHKEENKSLRELMDEIPALKAKMLARTRIIKQAENKVILAREIIKNNFKSGERWIVYCDSQEQLGKVLSAIIQEGFDAYEYHSAMEGDRKESLKYFETNGGIIVSIRCLDEGVDIPSASHALILASSKNPREFIQRRGRILRKYPGKYEARIYDAIVVPEKQTGNDEGSIIEAEIARAIHFGKWAENPTCITDLKILARKYGIDPNKITEGGEEDGDEPESE